MKQVIPTEHGIGVDSDHSAESDSCPPAKRAKVEPASVKDWPRVKQEYTSSSLSYGSSALPSLLRFSSNTCKFVPLSAMSTRTLSTDVDLNDCKLQVLGDDADSCSSFDDVNTAQLVTASENHLAHKVDGNDTELPVNVAVANSLDSAEEFLEPAEAAKNSKDLSVKRSSTPVTACDEQRCEEAELNESTLTTVNSDSEPISHCSQEQSKPAADTTKGKVKLPSPRHIKYLEMLLSV